MKRLGFILLNIAFILSPFFVVAQNYNYDYSKMPKDVQQKVDQNKAQGKNLLSGVTRLIKLELESCGSIEKAEDVLRFMSNLKGFYKYKYNSPGKVEFFVDAALVDYTILRDFIISNGVDVLHYRGESFELAK